VNRVQAYRPLGRLNKQQRDGYCVERSGCSPKTTVSIALTAVVEEAAMVRHHWASNRAYNEQYLLASYLLANPAYLDVQFCNYWTWSRRDHVQELAGVGDILGEDVRDRRSSACSGIKA
jgi:hypothetical protein